MNENINLVEILKDVPEGTIFFSPLYGDLTLEYIYSTGEYPIQLRDSSGIVRTFDKYGKNSYVNVECLLFPSKDQRDWSKFEIPLKDKELVWAWDNDLPFCRDLVFFDTKFKRPYNLADGKRSKNGYEFDHYERFTGEWPEWAVEAYKKLKD